MTWYKIQFEIDKAFKSEELFSDILNVQNQMQKAKINMYETEPVFAIEYFISATDINDKLIDLFRKYNAVEIFPSDSYYLKAIRID